jgi:hypothetical protein
MKGSVPANKIIIIIRVIVKITPKVLSYSNSSEKYVCWEIREERIIDLDWYRKFL